jgi:hypothetical protein
MLVVAEVALAVVLVIGAGLRALLTQVAREARRRGLTALADEASPR